MDFFSLRVPAPWIGIRKKYFSNTPLFGGVLEQNVRVLEAREPSQDGMEDGFFLLAKQGVLRWNKLIIPRPWDLHKPEQQLSHHPTSLTMIFLPSPTGPNFVTTARIQPLKMQCDVADDLFGRRHHSHCAADLSLQSEGAFNHPPAFYRI